MGVCVFQQRSSHDVRCVAGQASDVTEVLSDLTHIGRASVELDGDGNESEEEAYAEVVEYVRVGVQLIHDELIPAAAQHAAAGAESDDDAGAVDDDQDLDSTTLH